jgi:hypothetical protein
MMAMVFMPFAVMAADAMTVPVDSGITGWIGIVVAIAYGLAHTVALLPEPVANKLPQWVKSLLKYVAANYGKANNKDS